MEKNKKTISGYRRYEMMCWREQERDEYTRDNKEEKINWLGHWLCIDFMQRDDILGYDWLWFAKPIQCYVISDIA